MHREMRLSLMGVVELSVRCVTLCPVRLMNHRCMLRMNRAMHGYQSGAQALENHTSDGKVQSEERFVNIKFLPTYQYSSRSGAAASRQAIETTSHPTSTPTLFMFLVSRCHLDTGAGSVLLWGLQRAPCVSG